MNELHLTYFIWKKISENMVIARWRMSPSSIMISLSRSFMQWISVHIVYKVIFHVYIFMYINEEKFVDERYILISWPKNYCFKIQKPRDLSFICIFAFHKIFFFWPIGFKIKYQLSHLWGMGLSIILSALNYILFAHWSELTVNMFDLEK